ncbi:MAG: hypothetical protein GX803_07790 [Lentisphaerae bacterium]|jgi:hypothetical protein|nr:hypothetical protein [Lentisphaerota bacterium]
MAPIPPPPTTRPDRLDIDPARLDAFAVHLRSSESALPFDFCTRSEGFIYPQCNHPAVLDYLFFNCAHQFGFWNLANNHWQAPMIAPLDGHMLKGSDFLFRACTRAIEADPTVFDPRTLAQLTPEQLDALFHDDTGCNPLPMWPEHLAIIQAYTRWFLDRQLIPADLLRQANDSPSPLKTLLEILAGLPGYAEDPLQKKAMLLAITLENRPEHFLKVTDPSSAVPIIDYHLQRSVLRTGLVQVLDPELRQNLETRQVVSASDEAAVRATAYDAIAQLMDRSGLSAATVDWFFFQNRTRCPETVEPDCPACPVHHICARRTALFQPVHRTTAY